MVEGAGERSTPKQVLEPRFFARAEVEMDVAVEHDGEVRRGRSVNVSEGGLAVRLRGGPAKGAAVVVTFQLPARPEPIRAVGHVVRAAAAPGDAQELAIAFELGDEEAAAVRAVVADRGGIAWDAEERALPREVALRFIPLIRRVARGLAKRLPPDVPIDDLVGAGFVALVELHRAHAALPIEQLELLAAPRLRYAMLDELRDNDPLSRRMRKRASDLGRARAELELTLSRPPTRAELAGATGLSEDAVDEAERVAVGGRSAGQKSVHEIDVPDRDGDGPEENASRAESIDRLRLALGALPPRHRKVLELYYGDDLTLREIGNLLGVTEARISQLVSDAVKKLRLTMPSS